MVKKLQALKAKKGFTLVELIVVIAIIGVLAAILVPTMMGMVTKARVTSVDSTAAKLKDTVATWMVSLDTAGLKVPSDSVVTIKGSTGSWDNLSATNFDDAAVAKLKSTLDEDYDFTKEITAVVHVVDRKAVACAYADAAGVDLSAFTATNLRSGKCNWGGKDDGVIKSSGQIVGTYPKCICDDAGFSPAGTTSSTSSGG